MTATRNWCTKMGTINVSEIKQCSGMITFARMWNNNVLHSKIGETRLNLCIETLYLWAIYRAKNINMQNVYIMENVVKKIMKVMPSYCIDQQLSIQAYDKTSNNKPAGMVWSVVQEDSLSTIYYPLRFSVIIFYENENYV